jgi:transposase
VFIAVSAVFIVEKMATPQERAQTVVWFCKTKSETQTQRNFRTHYQKDPPSRNSIMDWKKKFLETGSVLSKKSSGRPSTSNDDDDDERVREA